MRPILELYQRLAALEHRFAGLMRHGTVEEVNTSEGWVRLNIGPGTEGGPLLGPKIPYAQMAGGLKVHAPPSVGQQMTLISPAGDIRQAIALPMTWSENNQSPGSEADPVLTFGDVRIDLSEGALSVSIGGVSLTISGGGLTINGGRVEHDGLNIGSDHKHRDVAIGGDFSGVPIP